ncbi:GNAT family N-acetyltransferase [Granulicella arctica]|uniref:Ribosomal protein S18 acetylase RimI-like enzyme n=1 Tax=Granulicella arctica TaxID=940613 RepID=A0A7Y9PKT7_9BACT|nr:N-acetyltransferase [Granulicella arctica]NYF80946.1 ribosomal protein S18 acetylase RimI-like enzyme [Granulicella arctica]
MSVVEVTVRVREYRKGDLEALVALDEVCFAPEFLFDRPSMRRFAETRNAVTVLAEVDEGSLAGFVIAHLERMVSGVRGYVITLDVAPEHRRAGLAGRLMQAAEDRVSAAGARSMDLHVFAENEAAIRFYEGRGYTRSGVRRGFYGLGLDGYLYRKLLHAEG